MIQEWMFLSINRLKPWEFILGLIGIIAALILIAGWILI